MKKQAKIRVVDYSDNSPENISPISDTVGKINAINNAMLLWDTAPMKTWASAKEDGTYDKILGAIKDYEKAYPDLNTTVYLGASPHYHDRLKDAFDPASGKSIVERIANILKPAVLMTDVTHAANHSDHYDPIADTISVYSPEESTVRHELGHALDRHQNYGGSGLAMGIMPSIVDDTVANIAYDITGNDGFMFTGPGTLLSEMVASSNALKSIGPKGKDVATNKKAISTALGAALGTYAAGAGLSALSYLNPGVARSLGNFLSPEIKIPGVTKALRKLKRGIGDIVDGIPIVGGLVEKVLENTPDSIQIPGVPMVGSAIGGLLGHAIGNFDAPAAIADTVSSRLFKSKEDQMKALEKTSGFKRGQMEANAAMIKEIAGQGDMERVAPGIDPEVISAIASILTMDGNGDSQEDMEALLKDNPELVEELV